MTWVRIDDQFPDHPKVIAAGPLAAWLYVCGLAYCNRYLTDGFIPERQPRRLIDMDDVDPLVVRLLAVGLWERVDGGYQVHDYAEYQPTKAKVEADREATRQRVEAFRNRKTGQFESNKDDVTALHERYTSVRNGVGNAFVTPAPNPNPNPNPNPIPNTQTDQDTLAHTRERVSERDAMFDAFWSAYPRKVAKDRARKAFAKRKVTQALLDRMLDAIALQKRSAEWTKDDGRFIPHPATWLNDAGWENELTPARASPNGVHHRNGVARSLHVVDQVFDELEAKGKLHG